MGTYTQILYQIVFSTKHRKRSLTKNGREDLFKYISGILKNKKCHLYQINGIEDHLHIVTHVHPSQDVATLVQSIKVSSSKYIKEINLFNLFEGWQDGYCAITYSNSALNDLMVYVKNQEEHHKTKTFEEEFIELLKENNIPFDDRYLF